MSAELAEVVRVAANVRRVADVVLVHQAAELIAQSRRLRGERPTIIIGNATQATSSVHDVMECIKAHESGNYTEQSHPGSGSGAFQYTPGTFRTWFARWAAATAYNGPSYAYAYQAPPEIQDAVTEYTLTHGGAGNWSPRYGNDPCTEGMR